MSPPRTPAKTCSWAATSRSSVRALALVVLAVQATTLGHQLLERHQLCREHGELIHTGLDHAHAESLAGGAELDGESSVRGAAGVTSDEHEHCGLACSGSKILITAPHPTSLPALAVVRPPSAPVATAMPDFRELHRLAPKQSPPV